MSAREISMRAGSLLTDRPRADRLLDDRPRRVVSLRSLLTLLLGTLVFAGLAGCSGIQGSDNVGAGYKAGDGSFATWKPEERGEPVDVSGETFTGEKVAFSDLRGDVVVINFWYASCPPCRAEAGDLVAVFEDYPNIRMIGVNPRDDAAAAQAFERTFGIPYPSINDTSAEVIAAMQGLVPLQAMPTTVILDHEGRVAARILGQADPTILRGLIDDVLAEV